MSRRKYWGISKFRGRNFF